MAIVWNPTQELVHTKMCGSWFKFAPDQRKTMNPDLCNFVSENRKDEGLVVLPDQFDPQSETYIENFDKTEEGKRILEEKREQGITNLITYHRNIVKSNQVSLRKDLARQYPNADSQRLSALEMSSGELASARMVAKYQKNKQDGNEKRLLEIDKLMKDIGPLE